MSLTVEKCLQAWTNSLRQLRTKVDIVFWGDSLTYYGDFASQFPEKVVCNLGLRGDTIQGMINRIEQVELLDPDTIFLMTGINDVACYDEGEFEMMYNKLVAVVCQSLPCSELILQSLLPVNDKDFKISCHNYQIEKSNMIISSIASNYKLRYIDLYTPYVDNGVLPKEFTFDGLHLRPEMYGLWYERIVC